MNNTALETDDLDGVYERMDTDSLLQYWLRYTALIARNQENVDRIERELILRMEAEGATEIPHPDFEVKLKRSSSWDYSRLATLGELVPEAELAKAHTPEHEETVVVPDKWDMRKALTFKKFGREVEAVLEAARLLGAPRLTIKRKEVV